MIPPASPTATRLFSRGPDTAAKIRRSETQLRPAHALRLFWALLLGVHTAGTAAATPMVSLQPSSAPTTAPSQLVNNSTRVFVGSGDSISIEEFVIQGNVPKKVILRGLGPSLGIMGVSGSLQDPILSLLTSHGTLIISNDNWKDSQKSEILDTGLAPTDDRESAIVATLSPGTYVATLAGKNSATGIGLNEVYDLETQSSTLAAIGTRGIALTGDSVVISGFIISGTQSQSVLFRALGPSLKDVGLTDELGDPVLAIYNADGDLLSSNDNWGDSPNSADIEATGLAPTNGFESANLLTLAPGNYTTIASGANSATGLVFLEAYTIPYSGSPMNPAPALPSPTPTPTPTATPTATPETATAVASSRSLAMDAFSGTLSNGTHVTNFVTTSDGVPGVSLFSDIYGDPYANEEVRPLQSPNGAYQADYVTFDDLGDVVDYGSFTVNLPTTDSDLNGLPDFEQKSLAGNFSFLGSSVSDEYGTTGTISGVAQRSANSTGGTYSVTLTIPGNPATSYSGNYYLLNASGKITYTRGGANSASFNLVEAFQSGQSRTLTGSTPFTVPSTDKVSFPQFNVSSSDGFTYTVNPFTLSRQASKYVGNMTLVDGDPLTIWKDYLSWVVEVTDSNDTDGDGIPDLSDVPVGPITGRPLNISTRLNVLKGENVLIAGFIITGTGPKSVLIRGIGPSLASSNIVNPLADPTLELHSDSATISVNDNWKDTQEAAIQATTVPPTNDAESAILVTLDPGAYTAILAGKNGATGVGLVEIYDLSSEGQSVLANISTRGFVGTGDDVMIGGFIIGESGGGFGRVIVRGIGPSLSALGVSGALQDPTIEVHDMNGSIIGSNDNWEDTQASIIVSEGLAPSDSRESALLMVLPGGAYTTILRGTSNSSGVGLVEAYNVP